MGTLLRTKSRRARERRGLTQLQKVGVLVAGIVGAFVVTILGLIVLTIIIGAATGHAP